MTEQNWRVRAACRNEDPELFFPPALKGPRNREWENQAKRVCYSHCPVRRECLTESLNRREEFGVWGGVTEWERRDMLRAPKSTQQEDAA